MKRRVLACVLIAVIAVMSFPLSASAVREDPETIPFGETGYADLTGDWYRQAAEKYGYPEIFLRGEDRFEPGRMITRMEFCRMLHKALGISIQYFAAPDIADYFDDVDPAAPGANALIDLVTAGIIQDEGSFYPDEQLRRDEMIHCIINAFKYVTDGDYALIMMMPQPFDDSDEVLPAYTNDIVEAVLLQLVNGRGNNLLHPGQGATRAEAVTLTDRLMTRAQPYLTEVTVIPAAIRTADGGLKMVLTITNHTENTVTVEHTSGQKYDFQLLDAAGEILYTWSADKLFIQALTTTEIAPGESLEFSDTLDRAAYQPIRNQAQSLLARITGSSADFHISLIGYEANITD